MCNLYTLAPKGAAERAVGEAGRCIHMDDCGQRTVGPFQAGVVIRPGGDDLNWADGRVGPDPTRSAGTHRLHPAEGRTRQEAEGATSQVDEQCAHRRYREQTDIQGRVAQWSPLPDPC